MNKKNKITTKTLQIITLITCSFLGNAQTTTNEANKIVENKLHYLDRDDSIKQIRKNYFQYFINTCFPQQNWDSTVFNTLGWAYNEMKYDDTIVYTIMSSMYSQNAIATKYLPSIINAGSTYPKIKVAELGECFYKIVKKGGNINTPSPYYLSDSMYKAILTSPCNLEQQLGLPLSSVSVQYDVFTIKSVANNNFYFNSIIAPTLQYDKTNKTTIYNTTGSAVQSLIINNNDSSKWIKSSLPIITFMPFCQPISTSTDLRAR